MLGQVIRHLLVEQRGDAWVIDGLVLLEVGTAEPSDAEVAALAAELTGIEDAVVEVRRVDGSSTTHRIRRKP